MDKKKTIIGKDVIESLTLGMYEDSKFIYREYIQNAADQIDKAVDEGLLSSKREGHIWINIDNRSKKISIEDNATGISYGKIEDVLKNIAQSHKERGIDKGFRGIGRLGGLGYCDELRFITSFKGEDVRSVMVWNAKELKDIINDRSKKETASDVIDKVVHTEIESEHPDEHYFKVELLRVNNAALFDRDNIKDYLRMVAPVAFPSRFMFKEKIYNDLKDNKLSLDEYRIYVGTEEIFKGYTTSIYQADRKKKDEIKNIKTFKLSNPDDELLAWGWYSISNFDGVIPNVNKSRGIRLRKDNIQIGSGTTLTKLHPQKKNQNYFFGEVHAFNSELIPNARRDYFIENECCEYFEKELRDLFDQILKPIFNIASKLRGADNSLLALKEKRKAINKLYETGITSKEEKAKIEHELEMCKERAEKGKRYLERVRNEIEEKKDDQKTKVVKQLYDNIVKSDRVKINKTADTIMDKLNQIPKRTDKYSKLTRKERKLIVKIFEVIDAVLNKELAENLKHKIDEKFT
jgi:molecular chaperone HtpG